MEPGVDFCIKKVKKLADLGVKLSDIWTKAYIYIYFFFSST
jgi:hypothetical protein